MPVTYAEEMTPQRTFFERVAPCETEDDCFVWTGPVDKDGYGRAFGRGAHRVAYEAMVGPINEGMTLDHTCVTPACVNPRHLDPVPMLVNQMRSTSYQAINAAKTACPQGHPYDGVNSQGRRTCSRCQRATDARHRSKDRAAYNARKLQEKRARRNRSPVQEG